MKKVPAVEFYRDNALTRSWFGWRLRAPNGPTILESAEFQTHRKAVESFKRAADAMDARGPWEIVDLDGVTGSHAMLTK